MQKRWSRIFAFVLITPLLLSVLIACGAGADPNAESGVITIKIGSNFPVSGRDETAGLPAQNGAEMAVKEAIEQNYLGDGYELVFDPRDDVGASQVHDPTTARTNYQSLIGDSTVAGIVGPLNSNIAQAVMGIANQAPIAMISPANTNDCLTVGEPDHFCSDDNDKLADYRPTGEVTYFRLATLDQFQGRAMADFAYNKQGYRKVFIVDDTETYGKGLADSFEFFWKGDFNGEVIEHRSIVSQENYNNLLTTIAAADPDFIFFGGNDSTGGTKLRQQMVQIPGLEETPLFVGDGAKTSGFSTEVIPTGGGEVFGTVPGQDASDVGQKATGLLETYQTAYNSPPGAYTTASYDSAWILIQSIKNAIDGGAVAPADSGDAEAAKTFRQSVIDAIKEINYEGASGAHSFDENGDTTNRNISIYTLSEPANANEGDGWTFVESVNVGA